MSRLLIASVAAVLFVVSSAHAAEIYGGPTYDSVASTGFKAQGLLIDPGASAGSGTAICVAEKFTSGVYLGDRGIRWDNSGAAATELGNLGVNSNGFANSDAYAINSAGVSVGVSEKYDGGTFVGTRPVRWDASGTAATELGNLGAASGGGSIGAALAINDAGTAVGHAEKYTSNVDNGDRAVRWDASGSAATELGNLGVSSSGYTQSEAYGLNASGAAVGYATKYTGGTSGGDRAVRWDASGTTATELGDLGTNSSYRTSCYAVAINDTGTAVGRGEKYDSGNDLGVRAIRWDASGTDATELGNLGVNGSGVTDSLAIEINDAGTAVGDAVKYVTGVKLGLRAVRWDASSTVAIELADLGTDSSGNTISDANAINDVGTIVGVAEKYISGVDMGTRAVAWNADGRVIDLNTLLTPSDAAHWTLNEAYGISDSNWVTGVGAFDPDGAGPLPSYTRTFLIQVPEPASLTILVMGALMMRRRRRI